jgi:hypothetical protein
VRRVLGGPRLSTISVPSRHRIIIKSSALKQVVFPEDFQEASRGWECNDLELEQRARTIGWTERRRREDGPGLLVSRGYIYLCLFVLRLRTDKL